MGKLAASDPTYLEKLAPRLWTDHIDSLWAFGRGIAKGSEDNQGTFEKLVCLMQEQGLAQIQPILFHGYIRGVYDEDQGLARPLQEKVLEIPELKQFFVYLLGATPIVPWGVRKLLEVARNKLSAVEKSIRQNREQEANENSRYEQRFE